MKQTISILSILCISLFVPNVVYAQNIFAKQKIVIADVRDVNDCKLDDPTKLMIRQSFVDACTKSNDYAVFEVNMDDIRRKITSSGQTVTFSKICEEIGEKADYIVFIEVMTNTSDRKNPNMKIYITSKLYRIATKSMECTDMEFAQPTRQSIMASVSTLLKKSLGIDTVSDVSADQKTYAPIYQNAQNTQYQPSQQHYSNSDTGDVRFYNGAIGVVVVLYDETGKHGLLISANQNICNWDNAKTWSSNLGAEWHLPSSNELNLIYKNKNKINHILSQKGFNIIDDSYYWTNDVTISGTICIISMFNGSSTYFNKSRLGVVRAVATF